MLRYSKNQMRQNHELDLLSLLDSTSIDGECNATLEDLRQHQAAIFASLGGHVCDESRGGVHLRLVHDGARDALKSAPGALRNPVRFRKPPNRSDANGGAQLPRV